MLITADMLRPLAIGGTQIAELWSEVPIRVRLSIAQRLCSIGFDDPKVAAGFRSRYRQLTTKQDGASEHEAFALRHSPYGMIFGSRGGPVFRWPHGSLSTRAFVFLADAVTISSLFFKNPRTISFHAAAVGAPGTVGAIVGDSNAGKTTTAVACARLGLRLYSDERCVVLDDGIVMPFPRAVNIRRGGLQLLTQEDVRDDAGISARLLGRRAGSWENADYRRLLGTWECPPPERLRSVFLLSSNGAYPRTERVSAAAAVRGTLRWAQCPDTGLERFARLLRLFSNVRCYRLYLGKPDPTARLIEQTMMADAKDAGP